MLLPYNMMLKTNCLALSIFIALIICESNGVIQNKEEQTFTGKGPFLYYVRVEGWVGGIAKYLLFLTGVGGWFWIILT